MSPRNAEVGQGSHGRRMGPARGRCTQQARIWRGNEYIILSIISAGLMGKWRCGNSHAAWPRFPAVVTWQPSSSRPGLHARQQEGKRFRANIVGPGAPVLQGPLRPCHGEHGGGMERR